MTSLVLFAFWQALKKSWRVSLKSFNSYLAGGTLLPAKPVIDSTAVSLWTASLRK